MTNLKRVSILGSTGSVGQQTLDVIRAHGPRAFRVVALTGHSNVATLAAQAQEFQPACVAISDESRYKALKAALSDMPGIDILAGPDSVVEAARLSADWTMAAIVGLAGLRPTLAAIDTGRIVAFASKECLVAAGPLMMQAVARAGATLLPVDSEHNAIFQCLMGQDRAQIERLILTASGGPFREWESARMRTATKAQALAHPVWKMGPKISVDSATMMNKALEVIEAHHLFAQPSDKIDVVIHPQSMVHSLVSFRDGSVLAQMGTPDMRTPISFCLGYPSRLASGGTALDVTRLGSLSFSAPDLDRFPALAMVRSVLQGTLADSVVFNAANEVAVAAFMEDKIPFGGITDHVAMALDTCQRIPISTLEDVAAQDTLTRDIALTKDRTHA